MEREERGGKMEWEIEEEGAGGRDEQEGERRKVRENSDRAIGGREERNGRKRRERGRLYLKGSYSLGHKTS